MMLLAAVVALAGHATAAAAPATAPAAGGDGIARDEGVVQVTAGGLRMTIREVDETWRTSFSVLDLPADEWRQRMVLMRVRQLANSEDAQGGLGVTEAQVAGLAKLKLDLSFVVPPKDAEALTGLYRACDRAVATDRPAAERALLDAMREVGTRTVAADRARLADTLAMARAILTPAQFEKVSRTPAVGAPPAAAEAASRPGE